MNTFTRWLLILLCAIGVLGAVYFRWQSHQQGPESPLALEKPAASTSGSANHEPAAPLISHPIQADRDAGQLPDLDHSDDVLRRALIDVVGEKAVSSLLNIDGFVRRLVATADNLGREHAPAGMWPIRPTPGRFSVVERPDGLYVADANAQRYAPFVNFAKTVDMPRAAALYRHLYPLFQVAYEQLGYPGKYFNDRVVAVIDQLLKTPEPTQPVKLTLTQVQGPIPSTRPWVRYQFSDPSLESRPAGQKILLRVGRENAHALKAKLAEFRALVANPHTN